MKELWGLLIRFRLRELFLAPTRNEWVRMFRYLFVGGVAFLFDYGTFVLTGLWLGDGSWAIALETAAGFMVGLSVNFLLSKRFVFVEKPKGVGAGGEFLVYGAIGAVGLALSTGLTVLGALVMVKYLARAIVAVLVLFYNYFARKFLLYRTKEKHA
ncbi:MAG: GtrA family protein [Candidatus Izemoplasmatales bacterium]